MAEVSHRPRCPAGLHSRATLRFQAAGLMLGHPDDMASYAAVLGSAQFWTNPAVRCESAEMPAHCRKFHDAGRR